MTLLRDPHQWALSAVGTVPRLVFMFVMYIVLLGFLIVGASEWDWRSNIGLGVFLAWFQLLQLYALRRLVLSTTELGR